VIDVKEFEAIQKKIEVLKDKKSKAAGAIENIMADLKNKFDISSIEEAEKELKKKEAEIAENEEFLESEYAELKKLHHWEFV
jgi:uncharacterized protein YlxP (DUF503 family)